MQSRLDTLATALRADSQVKGARIIGYADRIGNSSYNEKLSKKRAETIRQYLVAHGYVNTNVTDTRWLGSSEPATTCHSKMNHIQLIACLQPDRRVELKIDYMTKMQATR
jgi:outer membrane protein OmpA-like peptidoglycan-associated protein